MGAPDPSEILEFADAAAWEEWLAANHDRCGAVWLKQAKKNAARPTVTRPESLEVALCYGWIDSHTRSLDAEHFLQRYSPRRPQGNWSKVNVDIVETLTAAGRMRPSGLAAVESAKADGRWEAAYAGQKDATTPPDLEAALDASPRARETFDALTRSQRYAILLGLMKARRPETRTARLQRALASLEAGEKPR
ncbi:YdeI/OmpD-associated family protein [Actinomadura hibisca]|uniref:YdeI/OmpD-associated family protein n=1 Tax=Actinomadura hibisca TaxID=68565 RepID=UPI00083622B7|nr:YdeI/OmpD-associated family protein [Actinomadura hibisca]